MSALLSFLLPSQLSRWLVGIGLVLLLLLSVFLAGVHVEKEHRDAMDARREIAEWKAYAAALQRVAGFNKALQKDADDERNRHAKDKARIVAERDDALRKLRDRPARPANLPGGAGSGTGNSCTGRELYREDAEFLVREAAAADVLRAERDTCRARFESYQRRIREFNKGRSPEGVSP